jgi:prepilin-type processing-associated H-X9-DG protein
VAHQELPGPPPATWWHNALEPYTHSTWDTNVYQGRHNSNNGLYLCPSQARLVQNPTFDPDYWPSIGSYAYNDHGVAWGYQALLHNVFMGIGGGFTHPNPAVTSDFLGTKDTQVLMPSRMIALGDASLGSEGTGWALLDDGFAYHTNMDMEDRPTAATAPALAKRQQRHGGRWNILFCDGHVELLKTRTIFDYHQDEVLRLWNYDNQPHRELLP